MNFLTNILHVLGTGGSAYILARSIKDTRTRANLLASLYLSEASSVPYLELLKKRATHEGDYWLSKQLGHHAADELKHSRIFANALKQADREIPVFKRLSKEKRVSPLFEAYFQGYSREKLIPENIDWIVYAGSTYILELDSAKDYVRMAKVLSEDTLQERKLKIGLLSIAQDEAKHANYLYQTLVRRLDKKDVESVVDYWRTRKVQAMWAVADHLLKNEKSIFPKLITQK